MTIFRQHVVAWKYIIRSRCVIFTSSSTLFRIYGCIIRKTEGTQCYDTDPFAIFCPIFKILHKTYNSGTPRLNTTLSLRQSINEYHVCFYYFYVTAYPRHVRQTQETGEFCAYLLESPRTIVLVLIKTLLLPTFRRILKALCVVVCGYVCEFSKALSSRSKNKRSSLRMQYLIQEQLLGFYTKKVICKNICC